MEEQTGNTTINSAHTYICTLYIQACVCANESMRAEQVLQFIILNKRRYTQKTAVQGLCVAPSENYNALGIADDFFAR